MTGNEPLWYKLLMLTSVATIGGILFIIEPRGETWLYIVVVGIGLLMVVATLLLRRRKK